MYSPASKKRDGPHTQTHTLHTLPLSPSHTQTYAHMRTPPTPYYTDGTHFGFHDWIPTPQPQPHARTVGRDRHVVAASTVTVSGAVLYAVRCALCAVYAQLRAVRPGQRKPSPLGGFSDTSSRPVTDDALVYRCLVSSSLFPPKRNVAAALHLAFSLPQTPLAVSSHRGPGAPLLPLAAPGSLPPSSHPVSPGHPDTETPFGCGETWAPPGPRDRRWNVMMRGHGRYQMSTLPGGWACCIYTRTVTVAVLPSLRLARKLRCRGALVL